MKEQENLQETETITKYPGNYIVWTEEDQERLQKLETIQKTQKQAIDEWLDYRDIIEMNDKEFIDADMQDGNYFYNLISSFNEIEQYKKTRYGFNL